MRGGLLQCERLKIALFEIRSGRERHKGGEVEQDVGGDRCQQVARALIEPCQGESEYRQWQKCGSIHVDETEQYRGSPEGESWVSKIADEWV